MMRIDVYLVENEYFPSRSLAQDAIDEERVLVNGKVIKKASIKVSDEIQIEIIEKEYQFASRGGYKLYDALMNFKIELTDKVVLDVGASTGGFSDVCLQFGASYIYAVDIGKDQLIDRLKKDDRINNMEGVNCRYLSKAMFDKKIDFVCMDVSFISIKLIVDALLQVVEKPFDFVFLIKPQFEAGKYAVGKNGIVKDKKIHKRILEDFIMYFRDKNLWVHHLQKSSTIGRDGNQEYVIHVNAIPTNKIIVVNEIVMGKVNV